MSLAGVDDDHFFYRIVGFNLPEFIKTARASCHGDSLKYSAAAKTMALDSSQLKLRVCF